MSGITSSRGQLSAAVAGQTGLGGGGGLLIVVEQAFQRLVAFCDRFLAGELPGVTADEVVHSVAAVADFGEQALLVQFV